MSNVILKRNFESWLTEPLANDSTWEIAIHLNVAPDSQIWFLMIEPWVEWKEEHIPHHRVIGNVAYVYWVNRSNPVSHLVNARVVLSNTIDYLNYTIGQINEQTFIFKKSTQHLICKWGYFYIWSQSVVIPDLDTSSLTVWKTLVAWSRNYLYLKDYDYFLTTTQEAWLFLIATIDTSVWWVIQDINKVNSFSVWEKWEPWTPWVQWPQWYNLILRQDSWYLQWALDDWSPNWNNVVALTDIEWPMWESATFRVDPTWTYMQYKFPSDVSWTNIVEMSTLKWVKWDPWSIWATWNTQTIVDVVKKPDWSTVTYDDDEFWVKITNTDWTYILYTATWNTHPFSLASWVYNYDWSDNSLWWNQLVEWTYSAITHTITYVNWTTINWWTWDLQLTDANLVYRNESNTFEAWKLQIFNWDVLFNWRVSFLYNAMTLVWNDIIFDWSKAPKQYISLWDTVWKTISFKNLIQWTNYVFCIITDWETILSRWTVTLSTPITKIYTSRDRADPSTDWLPITLTGPDVNIFISETYNTAIHLFEPTLTRESI